MLDRTCSVDSCPRAPKSRGWCHAHYERWRLTGDTCASKPIIKAKNAASLNCTVANCTKGAITGPYCIAHARRNSRYGDPLATGVPIRPTCKLDDCDELHFGLGYCRRHLGKLRRQGAVAFGGLPSKTCDEGGCKKPSFVRGLCNAHYQRHLAVGKLSWTRSGARVPCLARGCECIAVDADSCLCPRHMRNLRVRGRVPLVACIQCGMDLPQGVGPSRRYCEQCATTRYKAASRAYGHRRRAVVRGSSAERFPHVEIFERDGWRCQLCRCRVQRRLRHPHPMSASLDHRVPIAKGGPHTRANCQLAHLRCNLRKRANAGAVQLMLIG